MKAASMSASKMRAAPAKGDLTSFQKGLPRGVNADALMKDVRRGMKLAANYMYIQNVRPIATLKNLNNNKLETFILEK